MELLICAIISWITGTCVGYILSKIKRDHHCIGTLREDRSYPDEAPFLFLELDPKGMETIHKEKKGNV